MTLLIIVQVQAVFDKSWQALRLKSDKGLRKAKTVFVLDSIVKN